MLVSYNWLKELVDFDYTPEQLADKLTMLGIEVEELLDFSKKYENFYTAEVTSCKKHPDADKLSVCEVSTGEEKLQVVCGAPNVAEGQKVVLGKIGAVVPSAGFQLGKVKLRGVESKGMICSQTELETGDDASGIWVLPNDTETGLPLAEYLDLKDTVIDVSITPNRADCLSHIGIAREIAALTGKKVKYPSAEFDEKGGDINKSIKIEIDDADKCPRYTARVVKSAKIGESPDWLKSKLTLVGLRPINAVVDATNYILMESGQPLHAFDLDKIAGNKIVVKTADKGDKFTTLDEKERSLDEQMLMICDSEKPVAVGGVMGGMNSEISDETQNILIESAYFNPSSVRRTARKLAINSDSSYRFERGVDPENVTYALHRAAMLIAELTGGTVEEGHIDNYPKPVEDSIVKLRFARAEKIIGAEISPDTIKDMLKRLNFTILEEHGDKVRLKAPPYRVDMKLEIDVIEEIARLYNYNELDAQFKTEIDFSTEPLPFELSKPPLRKEIADFFIHNGYNEIITQNQIDPKTAAFITDEPVKITNPLGEDLSIMRPSVITSVLKVIRYNTRMGNKNLKLFEIGKSFRKAYPDEDTPVKGFRETEELTVALTGEKFPKQWAIQNDEADFYDIKGIVEDLLDFLSLEGIKFKQEESKDKVFGGNTLSMYYKKELIGKFGDVHKDLQKHFDLENKVFIANIDLSKVYRIDIEPSTYKPVAPYPSIERDLSFVFEESFKAAEVLNEIEQKAGKYLSDIKIFDVYAGKSLGEGKTSIGFTLHFSSPERTLTDKEVDKSINKVVQAVEKRFNCKLRKQ